MSRWRILLVSSLLALPFVALAGVGSYFLWSSRLGFVTFWVMMGCMASGYFLAAYWQKKQKLLRPLDTTPPAHWTARDKQAWQLVVNRAKGGAVLDPAKLTDAQFYFNTAQDMARELAAAYHPGEQDAVANLTIPEILAVVELASHDLAEMVEQYLPAGHLLTIRDFRRAQSMASWYQTATNAYWAIAAVFNPITTGLQYAASRLGIQTPMEMLRNNLLLWFYSAFVNRFGLYLIDLNSGRLRVGATRYRELVQGRPATPLDALETDGHGTAQSADAADGVRQVTVTLLGQVKAGKSSLINALLGEQRAKTDVLPATAEVQRYELKNENIPTKLVLLDTVGYGHTGPRADQVKATRDAAQQSDLLLLVLHAMNPARQVDLDLLRGLKEWFASRPELKEPPVLAVVTHIDLLRPGMEWKPPYHWQDPKRPKEENIQEVVALVKEQLGDFVSGVVPVCVAAGKVYGVEEWLLPAIAERLDEAHGVALLRVLKAEVDTGKVRRVFGQLLATGREAAKVVWKKLQGK